MKKVPEKSRSRRVALDVRGLLGDDDLLRLAVGVSRNPEVDAWLLDQPAPLRAIARQWFDELRRCGDDVLDLLHDGCPVACVKDAPFAYVNVFRSHVNVGFFQGASLPDVAGLLEGSGKRMRHVKLRPDRETDDRALGALIHAAYQNIKARLDAESPAVSPAELISRRIVELGDWRGETLGRMRGLIREAVPAVTEEWKWRGTPVWSENGILCTGESYRNVVKLTFARGASLKDPAGLFNASLDGKVRRAIDIREGEAIDAAAFRALVRQAAALNVSARPKSASP